MDWAEEQIRLPECPAMGFWRGVVGAMAPAWPLGLGKAADMWDCQIPSHREL